MLTIGLEKEFFIRDSAGQLSLVPNGLPYDDCGWLVEARGMPMSSPVQAIGSLKADVFDIRRKLPQGYSLEEVPYNTIPRDLLRKARRKFEKGLEKFENFYGYTDYKLKTNEHPAGVHISFSKQYKTKEGLSLNMNFDWPSLFLKLDKEFESEIKDSKRRPGFYEIKSDGRVEYRSLPNNVDMNKLLNALEKLLKLF